MSTLVLRATKGSALTWTEADQNLTNLNTDKIESIIEDTTPQLGGTLDANNNIIDMGVNEITDDKVGQWDTAYGWGDHSVAGYLSGVTLTAVADNDILVYNATSSVWENSNTLGDIDAALAGILGE